MNTSSNNIYLKWIFLVVGLLSLFISIQSIISISSSVTDENVFTDPPSRIILNSKLNALLIDSLGNKDLTINPGVFLFRINNKRPKNFDALRDIIENSTSDSISFSFLHPPSNANRRVFQRNYKVSLKDFNIGSFTFLKSAIFIVDITKGGVSDDAGIEIGDIIIKINDKDFRGSMDAQSILIDQYDKKKINYTIVRGNELLDITVKLAEFELKFDYILTSLMGLFIIILSIFIGFFRFHLSQARILAFGLLGLGLVVLLGGAGSIVFFSPLRDYIQTVLVTALLLGLPTLFISFIYFPYERKNLVNRKKLIYAPALVSVLILIYFFIELFFLKINLALFIINVFSFIVIIYYKVLFLIFRKKGNYYERRFGRALNWSLNINILLLLINVVSILFFQTSLPSIFLIVVSLIPLSIVYTLARYGLLENLIKIRKNIVYSIIIFVLNASVYLFIANCVVMISNWQIDIPNLKFTGRSIELIDSPLNSDKYFFYGKLISVILSLIIIVIILKLKRLIFNRLETKFQISKFDFELALKEINNLSQKSNKAKDFSNELSSKISYLARVKKVAIFLFDKEGSVFAQSYHGIDSSELKEFVKNAEDDLYLTLSDYHSSVLVDYLPKRLETVFNSFHLQQFFPINLKGSLMGVIAVGDKMSESAFNTEDIAYLESISKYSATAIENLFLYSDLSKQERIKQELEIARRIQLSSLPEELPNINGIDIAGGSLPAMEVGGDFFDIYQYSESQILLVIGDVSGKGTSAALYMSKIQGILQTLKDFKLSPKDLLSKSNSLIYGYLEKSSFISSSCILFDLKSKKAVLARAGHLPTLHFTGDWNSVSKHQPKGIVLGLNKDELFDRNLEEMSIDFESGDLFIQYTDGIIEARNKNGDEFEERRLIEFIQNNKDLSTDQLRQKLIENLNQFTSTNEQFDDITIILIKIP